MSFGYPNEVTGLAHSGAALKKENRACQLFGSSDFGLSHDDTTTTREVDVQEAEE